MSAERDTINISLTGAIEESELFKTSAVNIDPYGRFAMLQWQSNFQGSGDSANVVRIDNDGKNMKLVRLQHSVSQGADDGRAFVTGGERGGSPNNHVVDGTKFVANVGTNSSGGRNRNHKFVDFDDRLAPKLESQDSHFFRHVGDSDSVDETKFYVNLYYVPDEEGGSSGNRLDL